MYSNKDNVNILTALLVKHGVNHVVVCPGSRNAPLVHNFNECPSITCHSVTDERSAGFIAIGLRQQLCEPVAVCVTSGSALLNVLPAAAEATYQHCGIIVISADRPQMWIEQLDGQTIPQPDALGRFVGKSVNLPEPHNDDERWYCQRLINEAFLALKSSSCPSVHINVPITEPLFDFIEEKLPEVNAVERISWNTEKDEIIGRFLKSSRPLIVVGQVNKCDFESSVLELISEKVPVLSEPLSSDFQTYTDQLIYCIQKQPEDYKPDCVLYIGGNTISKRLRQFLRSLNGAYQMIVSEDGSLQDVSQHTSLVIEGKPFVVVYELNECLSASTAQTTFFERWNKLRETVIKKHDSYDPSYSQMLAVKLFEKSINNYDIVYYANSMSVRLAALYANHYCYCNRGVNGIEGSLSVAAGASLAQAALSNEGHTYCVIGDLSFFYDENALWQQELGGNFRILLLNNSQGGIFRNLKGLDKSPVRDSLISAHHTTSAEGICQQFDIHYLRATDEPSLRTGLQLLQLLKSHRPILLEVFTDVNLDEQVFKEYYHTLL